MTLQLSQKDYFMNHSEIDACLRGEMCKIMRIHDYYSGETLHLICADVTCGGWTSASGRRFHVHDYDGTCERTGLGTFYLIRMSRPDDDHFVLEFTDDLNPDLP